MIRKFNEYNASFYPKRVSFEEFEDKRYLYKYLPFSESEISMVSKTLYNHSNYDFDFTFPDRFKHILNIRENKSSSNKGVVSIYKLEDDWFGIIDIRRGLGDKSECYICDQFEEVIEYIKMLRPLRQRTRQL